MMNHFDSLKNFWLTFFLFFNFFSNIVMMVHVPVDNLGHWLRTYITTTIGMLLYQLFFWVINWLKTFHCINTQSKSIFIICSFQYDWEIKAQCISAEGLLIASTWSLKKSLFQTYRADLKEIQIQKSSMRQ